MKRYISLLLLALTMTAVASPVAARQRNLTAPADTLPFTWQRFIAQEGIKTYAGTANADGQALTVYRVEDKFFLEIPAKALGRDIITLAQRTHGYMPSVMGSSVFRLRRGSNKHVLYLTYNRSLDAQADTVDANMMESIRQSNLEPIDQTLTVVSLGKGGNSYITDITQSVLGSNGLFDLSKESYVSNPDPARSEVTALSPVSGGVRIDMFRSQTDRINNTMDTQINVSTTTGMAFLIQLLPERREWLKLDCPFYGFKAISRQEYDTRTYVGRRRNYICRWNLPALRHITVYVSPLVPKAFRETVREAFAQWQPLLTAAGWKDAFHFSTDPADAITSYGHIVVGWGGGSNSASTTITDDASGEILAASLIFSDNVIADEAPRYYSLYRHIDPRVQKNMLAISVRRDILRAVMVGEIGQALGLKSNDNAVWQFTPAQLTSRAFLQKNGCTSSAVTPLVYNYLLRPADGVGAEGLLPRVSTYDRQAIAYAYGKSKAAPTAEAGFFYQMDRKDFQQSWKYPKRALGNDWVAAARRGADNCRLAWQTLHADLAKLPADQSTAENEHVMALDILGQYQQLMENVSWVVGAEQDYPVVRGVNSVRCHFPSKAAQQAALDYLSEEVLHGVPAWVNREDMIVACNGNVSGMVRAVAVSVYKRLLDPLRFSRLVKAENIYGQKTFTTDDLLRFIDHNLMHDYDKQAVPEYERLLQQNVLPELANTVFTNDVSIKITDEGTMRLHEWFIRLAERVADMAKNHPDAATRANYRMIDKRFHRNYFDKQH